MIANRYFARDEDIIGKNDMLTDLAIVPDMGIRHQEGACTDFRETPFPGSPVDRYALPQDDPLAETDPAWGGRMKAEVLGKAAHDGVSVDLTAASQTRPGAKNSVLPNHASRPDLDAVLDYGVSPN